MCSSNKHSSGLDRRHCLDRGRIADVHNVGTPESTCLLYFPLRLMSNSVKPSRSRSAAAVIGLSCSDRVKSDVQSENISGGTEINLQQQQQINAAQNSFASDKSLTPSHCSHHKRHADGTAPTQGVDKAQKDHHGNLAQ